MPSRDGGKRGVLGGFLTIGFILSLLGFLWSLYEYLGDLPYGVLNDWTPYVVIYLLVFLYFGYGLKKAMEEEKRE